MDIFTFNNHGVCMNPKTISFAVGKFSYELETAYINSGWIVGFIFRTSSFIHSTPCMERNDRIFDSEQDAIKYAAQKALDFFSAEHLSGCVKVPKKIFSNLNSIIESIPR